MILDNLSRAFKTQNWFAVATEFVIVIAGVVIGFQINAAYDRAQTRAKAETLNARLLADIRSELWRVEVTGLYYDQVSIAARRATTALEGEREVDNEALVIDAFRASQIFAFPVIRTTYSELVSTGSLDLITDAELLSAAVDYYEVPDSELSLEDRDRPYRAVLYGLLDHGLYTELAANCAEPTVIELGDRSFLPAVLDFPCDIEGLEREIAVAAERLREAPGVTALLRQRAIEASIEARQNAYWLDRFAALPALARAP